MDPQPIVQEGQSSFPFEPELGRALFNSNPKDKTYTDKLLAVADIQRMQQLHKKDHLNRSEWNELLHLIISTEAKLLNFDDWDRVGLSLFFTQVRSMVQAVIRIFDVKDILNKYESEKDKLSPRVWILFDSLSKKGESEAKYIVDVFLYVARTSVSVSGHGFNTIASNKYDIVYSQQQSQPLRGKGAPPQAW